MSARENPYERLYGSLPFVDWGKRGKPARFWAPRSTGDYTHDCLLGEAYARAALPVLCGRDGAQLLRNIVLGILKDGDRERDLGIIVGMMGTIGRELAIDVQPRPIYSDQSEPGSDPERGQFAGMINEIAAQWAGWRRPPVKSRSREHLTLISGDVAASDDPIVS
jgi:hypothetical protein